MTAANLPKASQNNYSTTYYTLKTWLSVTLNPENMIKCRVKAPNVAPWAVPTRLCSGLLEFALLNYWPSFAANASVQTNQRGTPRAPLSSARHSAQSTPTLTASSEPVWGGRTCIVLSGALPVFSPVALSPPPAAVFLADMAGAGTPGPRTPMLHVENEGGGSYLQRGERKRRGEGGGGGRDGEACIIDLIFFFTTNSIGRVGWA